MLRTGQVEHKTPFLVRVEHGVRREKRILKNLIHHRIRSKLEPTMLPRHVPHFTSNARGLEG